MKLSNDFKKNLLLFVYYYNNGTLGFVINDNELLRGVDYKNELLNEASMVEMAYTIYLNNIKLDNEGIVLNQTFAMRRSSQYIKSVCDSNFEVDPDFEDWEMEIN